MISGKIKEVEVLSCCLVLKMKNKRYIVNDCRKNPITELKTRHIQNIDQYLVTLLCTFFFYQNSLPINFIWWTSQPLKKNLRPQIEFIGTNKLRNPCDVEPGGHITYSEFRNRPCHPPQWRSDVNYAFFPYWNKENNLNSQK